MNLYSFYTDKVVLVTGSSMGIGKEIAQLVLLHGGKVVITARNKEKIELVEKEFHKWSDHLLCHQGDAAHFEDNVELVKKIIQKFGRLDILINNAGLSCFGEVEQMEASVAKKIIDTNIYGSLFPVMAALPELKKTKGTILFISSIAGFYGLPGYSAYSLSKMSLKALAQSLSVELNNSGVSVCISYVGFTENETDKKTLSPNGIPVAVPSRPKALTVSRTYTAIKILKQAMNKRFSCTHSFVGNITHLFSRFFPFLMVLIFKFSHKKTASE